MTPDQQALDQLAWTPMQPGAPSCRDGNSRNADIACEGLPYVTHTAVLQLDEQASLRCYQLSTGERIFDQRDVLAFLFPDPDPQADGLASTPVPAAPGNY